MSSSHCAISTENVGGNEPRVNDGRCEPEDATRRRRGRVLPFFFCGGHAQLAGRVQVFGPYTQCAKSLLGALLRDADDQGICWPQLAAIQRIIGRRGGKRYSDNTLNAAAWELKKAGILDWHWLKRGQCFPVRDERRRILPGKGPRSPTGGRIWKLNLAALRQLGRAMPIDGTVTAMAGGLRSTMVGGFRSTISGSLKSPLISPNVADLGASGPPPAPPEKAEGETPGSSEGSIAQKAPEAPPAAAETPTRQPDAPAPPAPPVRPSAPLSRFLGQPRPRNEASETPPAPVGSRPSQTAARGSAPEKPERKGEQKPRPEAPSQARGASRSKDEMGQIWRLVRHHLGDRMAEAIGAPGGAPMDPVTGEGGSHRDRE
jgi:hypothetical protein